MQKWKRRIGTWHTDQAAEVIAAVIMAAVIIAAAVMAEVVEDYAILTDLFIMQEDTGITTATAGKGIYTVTAFPKR